MVPKTSKLLRAAITAAVVFVWSFSVLRPIAELLATLIRRHWPEGRVTGSIVWYSDLLAASIAIAIAIAVGRFSFLSAPASKADRVDRLLVACATLALTLGLLQWTAGHYLRALLAAVTFLFIVPWLGKKWINRPDRQAGV